MQNSSWKQLQTRPPGLAETSDSSVSKHGRVKDSGNLQNLNVQEKFTVRVYTESCSDWPDFFAFFNLRDDVQSLGKQ